VAFSVRVWVAIPFALEKKGKIWGGNRVRAATREDKSLRDASWWDVAGGEGVAERSAWAEVKVSTCEVKKVTEAPRSLTMAMSWARSGAIAS